MNVNGCVDKAHEGKPLKEIIKCSVDALEGVGEKTKEVRPSSARSVVVVPSLSFLLRARIACARAKISFGSVWR